VKRFLPWNTAAMAEAKATPPPNDMHNESQSPKPITQFDNAWRCIAWAMTSIETSKEGWPTEPQTKSRCRRRNRRGQSGSLFRARTRNLASTASKILGATRGD